METAKKIGKTIWQKRAMIIGAASVVSSFIDADASAEGLSDIGADDESGAFDTDGDGLIDTVVKKAADGGTEVLIDTTGDGIIDTVAVDFDGDGKFDAIN